MGISQFECDTRVTIGAQTSTPVPNIKAHLVLGAGGVRTLAYVGAIEKLEEANIEFQSISACSAGCLVGAVLATGLSMKEVKQKVRETDLTLLISRPRLPKPLLFLTALKWPFAKYNKSGIASPRQLVTALARMGQDLAQQMAGR
ncbi:MAG: patatin-like phospholipase family protein [Cyanobium sp.]